VAFYTRVLTFEKISETFIQERGKVAKAGNRGGGAALEHRRILAHAAEQDGSPQALQRNSLLLQLGSKTFVGCGESAPHASSLEKPTPHLPDVAAAVRDLDDVIADPPGYVVVENFLEATRTSASLFQSPRRSAKESNTMSS
jgi:hypothetical protein